MAFIGRRGGRDWQRKKTIRQNGNLNISTYNGFEREINIERDRYRKKQYFRQMK